MKSLFVVRKDLKAAPEDAAAAVAAACEAWWKGLLSAGKRRDNEYDELLASDPWRPDKPALYKDASLCRQAKAAHAKGRKTFRSKIPGGRPTETVEAELPKGLLSSGGTDVRYAEGSDGLARAKEAAGGLGFSEGLDFWTARSGRTEIGVWFRPMPDEDARKIAGRAAK